MLPPSGPNWLTTVELADRWRLSARTLERWRVGKGGPPWYHFGGSIRYDLADVQAFESRSRSGSAHE